MKATACLMLFLAYSVVSFCQQKEWKNWRTVKGTWVATDYSDTSKQNPSYLFTFYDDGTIDIMIPFYRFPKTSYKIDKEKKGF